MKYPNATKLAEASIQLQHVIEFCEWLRGNGYVICVSDGNFIQYGDEHEMFKPAFSNPYKLFMDSIEIDQVELENERRAMLADLVERNAQQQQQDESPEKA